VTSACDDMDTPGKKMVFQWPAIRSLTIFLTAALMGGCGASLKQELPQMAEWVRYVDAAVLMVAASLFSFAGIGLIRHRESIADFALSFPPNRWMLLRPRYARQHYTLHSALAGLLAFVAAVLLGAVSIYLLF